VIILQKVIIPKRPLSSSPISFIYAHSLCFFHLPPKTMPGLTAPSDYSKEPPRHPSLQINAKVINHTKHSLSFFKTLILIVVLFCFVFSGTF